MVNEAVLVGIGVNDMPKSCYLAEHTLYQILLGHIGVWLCEKQIVIFKMFCSKGRQNTCQNLPNTASHKPTQLIIDWCHLTQT